MEVYPDASGARHRLSYLKAFSGSMLADGYDYVNGAAILRISSVYTPSQASAFDAAFSKTT